MTAAEPPNSHWTMISDDLAEIADYHGLTSERLARLGEFSAATPELRTEFADRLIAMIERLGSDHPTARKYGHLDRERFERLGDRLLSGRLDNELLSYFADRITHYELTDSEPRWFWPWAPMLPGLVAEFARRSRQEDVVTLGETTYQLCLCLTALMSDIFAADRNRRVIEAQVDQRFRTLVESSNDVITLVSDDDRLTVMTPKAAILDELLEGGRAETMGDLLSGEALELWRTADRSLRDGRSSASVHAEVVTASGQTVILEGAGRTMTPSGDERVWTWQDVTSELALQERLNFQAYHDSLTGVANRTLLNMSVEDTLQHARNEGKNVSLLFCDLDNFKFVNDTLGHAAGDAFLKLIVERLQTCLRDTDLLARLGGDEFAVLLDGANEDQALIVADRIINRIGAETVLDGQIFFPSASVGVVAADHEVDAVGLLRRADQAMYAAKRAGRGRVRLFREDDETDTTSWVGLAADLRQALANDGLEVHYQPTVDLSSGVVEGVEALLRWEHPTQGRIPPDQFVPVAEATGLIVPIGEWVLKRSCRDALELGERTGKSVLVHVNVSPLQLRDPDLVNIVLGALETTGLPSERLVLEVTENALLDDPSAIQRLRDLRAAGVRIAIDDFGTGYTSINYLQQLPVDIIKIDRSFVSQTTDRPKQRESIVQAILVLAQSLELQTVAEGIETEGELTELRSLGCTSGQGWYWSPAKPLDRILEDLSDPVEI